MSVKSEGQKAAAVTLYINSGHIYANATRAKWLHILYKCHSTLSADQLWRVWKKKKIQGKNEKQSLSHWVYAMIY